MSRALQALAWIAPGAAMKRARAFSALDQKRAYDGARVGRRGDSFTAAATSANVEIGPALARLRDRSRDLARNTWAGRRILDVHVGHTIGTGINAVPATGSDRTDRQLGDAWLEWCDTSDVEGINNFAGQQALLYSSALEGGDAVMRRIPLRSGDRRRVKLALQVLEGDLIDESRDLGTFDNQYSRLGVGLGTWDARTGLWLHSQHPGEYTFRGAPFNSTFVPVEDVIHLFRPLRAGQVRGVPVFAPILMPSRDLGDLVDAVIMKAKTEACYTGFVTLEGERTSPLSPSRDDARIEEMRPGMIAYLQEGEKISFAQPTSSGQYEQVWLSTLFGMAAGAGITYDQLTGDLRQANYSSLRAGKIEQRRLTEQTQYNVLVPQMMRRVTNWFVDAAILADVIKPRRDGWRFDYVMPAVEPIDPRKDLEADILAVRAGRMTPQTFISAWGEDWRKVIKDTSAFLKIIDAENLVLDIDPRRTSQLGVAQADAANEKPAADAAN
ncbi:phage portal protein, lambda family [Faunimonas pinastri]|uniref:Phage portal protein, lambda family n=1 Tax=Faunimonas pinastri TaxID=1855383 RepID=A0A1H9GFL6_9HYPH|nr:phage portal protein [Faunimonas pinastri]SEQ48849.1 phage portal protein, lambda family [Faunimonas pinastri]